ncbi:AAA family ATPase [Psychromonas sp. SP041]|jgi:phosphoribosyl-ATP pyrophosphohydrolase|uniref:AAA family ATPase n=1 Tax=Psychromonas sp. SP041 TaxID=1365007 RepID=UPI0004117EEF|nr:AAA family ATPase [Psychromonas sp. SP041]
MLIVDYQSKSYHRFLNDMPQIANHKTRFLITFNGANESDLAAVSADLTSYTKSTVQHTTAIIEKASESAVAELFTEARISRNILLFENSDLLFDKKTEVKNSHERDNGFDLNNLFKNIAKHNGMVILATDKKQTLSATMSTKMDVVIRFK